MIHPSSDEFGDPKALLLEWYRHDVSNKVWKAILPAASMMLLGSFAAGVSFAWYHRIHRSADAANGFPMRMQKAYLAVPHTEAGQPIANDDWAVLLSIVGIAMVAVSGLWAIWQLRQILQEESYVALRSDGLVIAENDRTALFRWDEIDEIEGLEIDGAQSLSISREGEEIHRTSPKLAGIEIREVAKRANFVRRRVLMGLR